MNFCPFGIKYLVVSIEKNPTTESSLKKKPELILTCINSYNRGYPKIQFIHNIHKDYGLFV